MSSDPDIVRTAGSNMPNFCTDSWISKGKYIQYIHIFMSVGSERMNTEKCVKNEFHNVKVFPFVTCILI